MSQLSQSVRETVLDRDCRSCRFCGMGEEEHKDEYGRSLSVHHIIKSRVGGSDDPENLITVCRSCHKTIEHTQGEALERIKEKKSNTSKINELKQEKKELREQLNEERRDNSDVYEEAEIVTELLAEILTSPTAMGVHVTHQTNLTTSTLKYAGCDEEDAYKAYKDSEHHATMESTNVTGGDVIDTAEPVMNPSEDIDELYDLIHKTDWETSQELADAIPELIHDSVLGDSEQD